MKKDEKSRIEEPNGCFLSFVYYFLRAFSVGLGFVLGGILAIKLFELFC
jgi:hypothetical protein